jgi:hypothetical protein
VGDAHLFSRRAQVQPAFEVEPMRVGWQFAVRPALASIELGDQSEPTIVRRVQLAGEFGDLRLQFFQ